MVVGDPVRLGCAFESREFEFPQFGINLSVLEPGESNCLYHSESQQEAFLVLSGECRLLVEGEERLLRAWDFVHCPAGTEHVFVGAGDGPCVILMAGARSEDEQLLYPVSELAARYGASADEETPDPKQAYARFERRGGGPRTGTASSSLGGRAEPDAVLAVRVTPQRSAIASRNASPRPDSASWPGIETALSVKPRP